MQTVYNAVTGDTTLNNLIGGRMYWLSNVNTENDFPLLNFFTLDENGEYSFGASTEVKQELETVNIQIDIYAAKIDDMDAIKSRLKIVMNSIGYRQQGGAEQFDDKTQKVQRATRWEYANVDDF